MPFAVQLAAKWLNASWNPAACVLSWSVEEIVGSTAPSSTSARTLSGYAEAYSAPIERAVGVAEVGQLGIAEFRTQRFHVARSFGCRVVGQIRAVLGVAPLSDLGRVGDLRLPLRVGRSGQLGD